MSTSRRLQPFALAIVTTLASVSVSSNANAQVNGYAPTKLATSAATSRTNSSVKTSCRLTDLNNKGLAGRQVVLYLLAPSYTTRVAYAYTDNSGNASVIFSPSAYGLTPGSYQLGWFFGGDGYYGVPLPQAGLTVTK